MGREPLEQYWVTKSQWCEAPGGGIPGRSNFRAQVERGWLLIHFEKQESGPSW